MDFIEAFAFTLPARVISDLFGVPRERVEDLRKWSENLKDLRRLGPRHAGQVRPGKAGL